MWCSSQCLENHGSGEKRGARTFPIHVFPSIGLGDRLEIRGHPPPELKASLPTLSSVSEDGDDLTNTQEQQRCTRFWSPTLKSS